MYGAPDQYGMPVIEQVKLKEGTAYIDHDPTTGQPLSLRTTNEYEAYYIVDGIGSPVQFINQSTVQSTVYDYDSYGAVQTTKETSTAGVQNPYRFVGGTYDRTTGYVKYGQRWYDPTTGRFTTQDQYSFLANPERGNRYAYAGDNPINNIDPTGRYSWSLGAEACFVACLGGGYAQNDDESDGGGYFQAGCCGLGGGFTTDLNSGSIGSGSYGNINAVLADAELDLSDEGDWSWGGGAGLSASGVEMGHRWVF